MGEDDFSRDYSLTDIAFSFLIRVDNESIVENRMEIYGSALTHDLQKARCAGVTAPPSSLFEALLVASVVPLFESVVEALPISSASCLFKVVRKGHGGSPFPLLK
jgi:hypothetical protein